MNLKFNQERISTESGIHKGNKQPTLPLIQSNIDAVTLFLKRGNKIQIKKENRGKFTEYCGGNVTSECIKRGKNSSDPKIRKRATFAANARKWKHQSGGSITYTDPYLEDKRRYDQWNSLSYIDKLKRNFNIARQFISESPRIQNLYNATQAILGEYDPQNPYLITGVAPAVGKTPRIRKQSVSNANDKGLLITRKFNSAVKNGLTYEDGDTRHLNLGRRGNTAQQRERAKMYLSNYRVGTPEYKTYQNLYKKLVKKQDGGASKQVINGIKKEMNNILDNLIDQGYIQ